MRNATVDPVALVEHVWISNNDVLDLLELLEKDVTIAARDRIDPLQSLENPPVVRARVPSILTRVSPLRSDIEERLLAHR